METRSFIIPASKKSQVETQLIKLNKRAMKLNLELISLTWGKAFMEDRKVLWQNPDYPDLEPQWITNNVLVIPADISGPFQVAYDGWQFIATIQHLNTGENIIRAISNDVEIPKHYREAYSNCEHCRVDRYRKDTYLVQNIATKQTIQVGSTCISDFLGGNSPDDILNKANFIAELLDYMSGASNYSGHSENIQFHIEEFLAQTSACIRDFGWLSKTSAKESGGISTASRVQDNLCPPSFRPYHFKFSEVIDSDRDKAKLALEWVESLSDDEVNDNDYLYHIRAIARSGMVEYRTMGFAASILVGYDNTIRKFQKKDRPASKHIGTIKKREIFSLILKYHASYDSQYGVFHRYIFEDDDGNVFVWGTSKGCNMVEGKKYAVKATVKAHSEFKNQLQTEINRCDILNTYEN